jgi:hypothetical protein
MTSCLFSQAYQQVPIQRQIMVSGFLAVPRVCRISMPFPRLCADFLLLALQVPETTMVPVTRMVPAIQNDVQTVAVPVTSAETK